jgi:hypothetical protein
MECVNKVMTTHMKIMKISLVTAVGLFAMAGVWFWRYPMGKVTLSYSEAQLTQSELMAKSEIITVGTITKGDSFIDRTGSKPVVRTRWMMAKPQVLKGEVNGAVEFNAPGGRKMALTAEVLNAPKLKDGDKIMIFLVWEAPLNGYVPLSLSQGIYESNGDAFEAINGVKLNTSQVAELL